MQVKRSSMLPGNGRSLSELSEMSTVELVKLAQSGEREALDPLFRRYSAEILRFAVRRLDGNRVLAEDVAAETWVTAVAQIDRFRLTDDCDERSFVRWLYGITRHSSRRKLAYVWRELPSEDAGTWADDAPLLSSMAETAQGVSAQRQQMLAVLVEVLDALPARQGEVARLRLDGLTGEEIADRLGLSVEQVNRAWVNAFDSLRRRVAPAQPEAGTRSGVCRPTVRPSKRLGLPARFDRAAFRAAADSLPAGARRVAQLKLERWTNEAIAEVMGCPVSTVASHWHRACLAFAEHGLMAKAAPATLDAAVESLPPAARRIVQLRLAGMSHKAIAEAVGRTTSTVGTTWHRARHMLAGQGHTLAVA